MKDIKDYKKEVLELIEEIKNEKASICDLRDYLNGLREEENGDDFFQQYPEDIYYTVAEATEWPKKLMEDHDSNPFMCFYWDNQVIEQDENSGIYSVKDLEDVIFEDLNTTQICEKIDELYKEILENPDILLLKSKIEKLVDFMNKFVIPLFDDDEDGTEIQAIYQHCLNLIEWPKEEDDNKELFKVSKTYEEDIWFIYNNILIYQRDSIETQRKEFTAFHYSFLIDDEDEDE